MNSLILLSSFLSIALGIGRGADIALGIDPASGLCVAGSVWWRYAALGIAVLAAVLIGRRCAGKAGNARSRQPVAGVLAFVGAVCFLAAAGIQLMAGTASVSSLVRAVLQCICAVWLITLGCSWLSRDGWKTPVGGLYLAVPGSVLFYWNVLMRFMENSSSWQRVDSTAAVWQELAALVLLAGLARALYLPKPENGRTLCAAGLAAFALCLCWQLPGTLQLMAGLGWAGMAVWPYLLADIGLCCVGGIGAVCAWACANGQT